MRQRLNRKKKREGAKRLGSAAERAGWRFNDQLAVGAEVANRIQCPTGTTQQLQEDLAAVSRGFEKAHVIKQVDVSTYVLSGHFLPPSEEADLRTVLESRKREAQLPKTTSGLPSTGDTGIKKATCVPAPPVATGARKRASLPEPQAVNGGTGRGGVAGHAAEPFTGASRGPSGHAAEPFTGASRDQSRVRPHSSQDRRHRSPIRDHQHHRRHQEHRSRRSRSPAGRGGSSRNRESYSSHQRPRSPAHPGGPSHGWKRVDLRAVLNRSHYASLLPRSPIRSQSPVPSDLPVLADVPRPSGSSAPVDLKKKKKKTPKSTSAANATRLLQSAREDEHEQQKQQRHEAVIQRRTLRQPIPGVSPYLHRHSQALRQQERDLRAEVVRLTKNKEDTLGGTSPLLKGASASPATDPQLLVADEDGVTDAFEGFDNIESDDEEPVPEEVEEALLRSTSIKP